MIDYDPHLWRKHFFDVRGSMLRHILTRSSTPVLWAVGVTWLSERHGLSLSFSDKAHTLIGVSLGLLLVFRTNASYDRFWEGRKLWGAIVNETRNVARQARSLFGHDAELCARLVRWTAAFAYATMYRLRNERSLGPMEKELPPAEVEEVLQAPHLALAVARRMTELVAEARARGHLSDTLHLAMDQNINGLVDYLGACERIHTTPLPFAYVVHLRRAVILYTYSLPFVLLTQFHWGTVPVVLVLSYILFGIEEIGVEIENPFGRDDNDLPLERICQTIENNLMGMLPPPVRSIPKAEMRMTEAEAPGG